MANRGFDRYFRYIFFGVFLLMALLSYFVVEPFIGSIISALFIAYVFYPVYRRILGLVKNPTVASALMTFLVAFAILAPLILIGQLVVAEIVELYGRFSLESAQAWFANYFSESMQELVISAARQTLSFLVSLLSDFVLSIPQKVLNAFIMLFTLFVAFRGGERFVRQLEHALPVRASHRKEFVSRFRLTTKAIILGVVVVSLLQGIAAMVGFYVFGVSSPALWGFLTFLAAMLPIVGPAVVWVPIAVSKYLAGSGLAALGLVLYSIVIQNLLLDLFLKTNVIGARGKIPPLAVLLGIVGGVMAFGMVGILLGPLVLVLLLEFLKVYLGKNAFKG